MTSMWMVRAAGGGRLFEEFKEKGVVAIGWGGLGDLKALKSRDGVARAVRTKWPEYSDGKAIITGAQLYRFAFEMAINDRVVTYDPSRRVYLVGTIKGDYRFDPALLGELENVRAVKWASEVNRDQLAVATKNSLGAISSLFLVPPSAAQDIEAALRGDKSPEQAEMTSEVTTETELLGENEERAKEFIKDKLNKLDWDEMQELVAGILRAMGYKTRVSPSGPDQGKDIVASPDGLGFENPRIVVEVKHRSSSMGSQAIRSFLGGRHKDDRGLYVSTGGFSKDAHYEAERASIPLTLMDLDDLVRVLIENYEALDVDSKRLIPLKRIYWPA